MSELPFEGVASTAVSKPRKSKGESDGVALRLEAIFIAAHEARWRCKPLMRYGRDRKHLKDLASQLGEDGVAELVAQFFASTDPQVVRSDYSVAAFFRLAPHLRLRGKAPLDDRTAGNIEAAQRATGRKP